MFFNLHVALVFSVVLCNVNAINILGIFEIPSKSIHILGHEMLSGLAKRGHNVTLMSAFPMEKHNIANYTHVYLDGLNEYKENNLMTMSQGESKLGMFRMINVQVELTKVAMKSKGLQHFLKTDSKYDIIIQTYVLNEGYLGLAHHFNARVVAFVPFSSFPHITALTGNSAPYSYVSTPFLGYTDELTFLQRTQNTLAGTFFYLLHRYYLFPQQDAIVQEHFPNAPPLEEIQLERVDLLFANVHFSNELPRPSTPNIIHIGGYHVKEPEPLEPSLKKKIDNAKDGVVFMAFGSNVQMEKLPKSKLDAFLNKFAKTPYKFFIKSNGELPNKPKNVETSSWYPQKGILAHPNTKVFISHGGRGSATESLHYGVPILCVSIYGDQKKNCEDIVDYGYGIHLPIQEVTEESFAKAFDELTTNPRYKEKAKFRSALAHEQEMDPMDRICFWINHIYKFNGAKHLQPKSVTMPLYQYLLLDVWFFILSVTGLLLFIFYKITIFVIKKLCCKHQKTETQKKVKKN